VFIYRIEESGDDPVEREIRKSTPRWCENNVLRWGVPNFFIPIFILFFS